MPIGVSWLGILEPCICNVTVLRFVSRVSYLNWNLISVVNVDDSESRPFHYPLEGSFSKTGCVPDITSGLVSGILHPSKASNAAIWRHLLL